MASRFGLRAGTYNAAMYSFWPGLKRFGAFVALAGCCALVLYGRVYLSYDRVRITVVDSERVPSDGSMAVILPDLSRLAEGPTAIVLTLHNQALTTRSVMVADSDASLSRFEIRPNETLRVDLSVQTGLRTDDTLHLVGDGGGWSLRHLEVGNAHGFSHGLFSLVVVPQSVERYDAVSIVGALSLFVVLLVLTCPLFRFDNYRYVRRVEIALITVVSLLFLVIAVLPMVSQYKVLLSLSAFSVCLGAVYLPVTLRVARDAYPALRGLYSDHREEIWDFLRAAHGMWVATRIKMLYSAVVVLFLVSVSNFYSSSTGFTSLILFGDRFEAVALPAVQAVPHYVYQDSPGYDGQFYAQLAVDPLVQDPAIERAIDTFGYRAPRILFSWTAFLLGLGQPALILQAYSVQNILCWLALAWLLLRWFPALTLRNFVLWFACLFGHGLIASVRLSLLAGPSLLLLALAIIAIERGRPWIASAVLGLSGLGRETNLLAGACLFGRKFRPLRVMDHAAPVARIILVGVPLALWLGYLYFSDHGVTMSSGRGNLAAPLSAFVAKWDVTLAELQEFGWTETYARFSFLSLVSLTTQALFLMWQREWTAPWWRIGIAYTVLMVFLGPAVWAGDQVAANRVLLPMTVAFNVQLAHTRGSWPLVILGNLTVLHGLESLRVPWLWPYL